MREALRSSTLQSSLDKFGRHIAEPLKRQVVNSGKNDKSKRAGKYRLLIYGLTTTNNTMESLILAQDER